MPIKFDVLAQSPLIRRAELEGKQFAGYSWDTQMSGVKVPREVAQELELLWSQRVEGAKRGEVLPAILPSDVDRWRTYLQAATEDSEYIERHRLGFETQTRELMRQSSAGTSEALAPFRLP